MRSIIDLSFISPSLSDGETQVSRGTERSSYVININSTFYAYPSGSAFKV